MELTRRDAVAALAALGAGGGAVGLYRHHEAGGEEPASDAPDDPPEGTGLPDDRRVGDVAVAIAEVVYPSEVTGTREFVGSFLDGRLDRSDHGTGIRKAVAALEGRARDWHGSGVVELDRGTREQLLREVGADTAEEDPEGTTAERVRYYLVNELLLALYASPTGGELVGIENPQGHPGGTDSYQRGPR
jgi:hypothetical protein